MFRETPTWRTNDIVELCRVMRESKDYSAMPVLADLLEEAGYSDDAGLRLCRSWGDEIERQKFIATIYSDETAAAVKRIEAMVLELGPNNEHESDWDYGPSDELSFRSMMETAATWDREPDKNGWRWGDYITERGTENWRDEFPRMADEFWRCYSLVVGKEVGNLGSFFSCSC